MLSDGKPVVGSVVVGQGGAGADPGSRRPASADLEGLTRPLARSAGEDRRPRVHLPDRVRLGSQGAGGALRPPRRGRGDQGGEPPPAAARGITGEPARRDPFAAADAADPSRQPGGQAAGSADLCQRARRPGQARALRDGVRRQQAGRGGDGARRVGHGVLRRDHRRSHDPRAGRGHRAAGGHGRGAAPSPGPLPRRRRTSAQDATDVAHRRGQAPPGRVEGPRRRPAGAVHRHGRPQRRRPVGADQRSADRGPSGRAEPGARSCRSRPRRIRRSDHPGHRWPDHRSFRASPRGGGPTVARRPRRPPSGAGPSARQCDQVLAATRRS